MEITNINEINKQYLGKGLYGRVYRYQDKAIKLYHPILYKHDMTNPCLKLNRKKFKLMKIRKSEIKHTFLVGDLLYINGAFSGVVYPYVEGENLGKLLYQLSIDEKQKLSKQLLRNAKELTDHQIYPKDYRLPNILRDTEGNIKIIDIDDIHTKVTLFPNPMELLLSLKSLKRALIDLLEDDDYFNYRKNHQLQKYTETLKIAKAPLITYQNLRTYIDKKTNPFKSIFINTKHLRLLNSSTIENINTIMENTDANLILISETLKDSVVENIFEKEIPLYDYIDTKNKGIEETIEKYLKKHNIINPILLNQKDIGFSGNISEIINSLNDKNKSQKIKTL